MYIKNNIFHYYISYKKNKKIQLFFAFSQIFSALLIFPLRLRLFFGTFFIAYQY